MGALTSKPYAFTARPWELTERESFDLFDPFGGLIKLSFRGKDIMRILPSLRFFSSDEWIADRTRFSYDSVNASSRLRSFKLFCGAKGVMFFPGTRSWFTDFLYFRSTGFSTIDHFSFSYIRTFKFFQSTLGIPSQSNLFDSRFSPTIQLSNFYASINFVRYLFLFDINIRFTLPVLAIKLRQIMQAKSTFSVFSVGPTINNLISEINVSNNFKNIYLLRGKSRLSRLVNDSNSYAIFSYSYFFTYRKYISSFFSSFSVFFTSPIFASRSELCFSGFYNIVFNRTIISEFNSYKINSSYLQISLPHHYESDYVYITHNRIQAYAPSIASSSHFFSPFKFQLSYYISYTVSPNYFYNYTSYNFIKSYFPFSNYFTHFTSGTSNQNSTNILLNLKRHNEFRSNYIYFL